MLILYKDEHPENQRETVVRSCSRALCSRSGIVAIDGGDKSKIVNIGVCSFIRDKGDKCKSGICNLRDGSQLYANK